MAVGFRLLFAFACTFVLAAAGLTVAPERAKAQVFLETPDLGVRIRPPEGGCARGRRCRFTVIVGNRGDAPFSAPISTVHEARPPRLRLSNADASGWLCQRGSRRMACLKQRPLLNSGDRSRYGLSVLVPRDVLRRRIRVCVQIDWRRPGALNERTRIVQRALLREGYRVGRPDGEIGPATRNAIASYQSDEGLPVTGRIDQPLLEELADDWGVGDARARNDRACVQARLYNPGSFEDEPNIVPPLDKTQQETRRAPEGGRLRCPPSRVQDGRSCVCRAGTIEDATGACIAQGIIERAPVPAAPAPAPAPPPPPEPQLAACSGGKERNAAGRCVCPRGLEDVEGLCQLPQARAPAPKPRKKVIKKKPLPEPNASTAKAVTEPDGKSCKNNMILNENGQCQCYLNLKNSDGKCLVKVRAKCLPGEIINVRGKCECPDDREIRDGKCVLRTS
ncbi:MAG: peptidoglycan-binding domain-containing protein [Pseudomonadota bacterium]